MFKVGCFLPISIVSASLAAQAAAHSLNGAIAAGGMSPSAYAAAAAAAAAGFPMTVSQPGTPGATDSVYTNGLAQYSRNSQFPTGIPRVRTFLF